MKREHLGDAFDFWKGGVIGRLSGAGHLRDVHVLPMITDSPIRDQWQDSHFGLYADLLCVRRDRILRQEMEFTAQTRAEYFRVGGEVGDIFVDPDTGLEPATGGSTKHLLRQDLAELLPERPSRVVLVYQHAYRKGDYAAATLRQIAVDPRLNGCRAFAYKAGSVSMVFVSRDEGRLVALRNAMHSLFSARSDRISPMHGAHPSCP